MLADILKDLTARTTLIATLYQSTHAAGASNHEHAQIVAALEAGDTALAIARLRAHIGSVCEHLGQQASADDPLAPLRAALTPLRASDPSRSVPSVATPGRRPARRPPRQALFTDLVSTGKPAKTPTEI